MTFTNACYSLVTTRGFAQVMKEQQLKHVEADLSKQMKDRAKEGTLKVSAVQGGPSVSGQPFVDNAIIQLHFCKRSL